LQCLSELGGVVHAHADGPVFEFTNDSYKKLLPPPAGAPAAPAPAAPTSAAS